MSPYEGGIRVPLIVRYPGVVAPGAEVNTPTVGADLFPTLLELAGATRDAASTETLYGQSIVPLLKQTADVRHDALYWHYPHYWHTREVQPHSVIRAGDWKLIEFFEDIRVELYNLANDGSEKTDLAKTNPAKVDELRGKLHKWREEVGAQMPTRRPRWRNPSPPRKKRNPRRNGVVRKERFMERGRPARPNSRRAAIPPGGINFPTMTESNLLPKLAAILNLKEV